MYVAAKNFGIYKVAQEERLFCYGAFLFIVLSLVLVTAEHHFDICTCILGVRDTLATGNGRFGMACFCFEGVNIDSIPGQARRGSPLPSLRMR